MDDADGGLSFDFEGGLDVTVAGNAAPAATATGGQLISTVAAAGLGAPNGAAPTTGTAQAGRKNYRQTVCRHWLRGLCMKGDACGFLHQLDRSRMPVCRFFSRYGECHEPDCVYKHTYEDIKECNMYKMGFCPNGPECRYRHVKLPGPFPPVEESLQKIQVRNTNTGNRPYVRHANQRQQGQEASQMPTSVPPTSAASGGEDAQAGQQAQQIAPQDMQQHQQEMQLPPPPAHMPQAIQQRMLGTEQQAEAGQNPGQPGWQQSLVNGPGGQVQASASTPLPQGFSRFFIVKSSNRENLELSVARGLWATHRNNESKLNEAFDSCDNVILIFSVNETGHFQGCARMMSKIGEVVGGGGWKYAHGTAHYGRNFRLKWLKLSELSFNKTRHLRNPYKDNLPVKISRDCQELEPTVGEQLATLLYMEPDSELMKLAKESELKWEEEKARGGQEVEDSSVPFEVIEEDQDEEESDEDDSSNQTASQSKRPGAGRGTGDSIDQSRKKNKGRGRNVAGDPFAGAFERFPVAANGFKLPGGVPGRGFPPYPSMPRYGAPMGFGPMDGAVLGPGMVLSGRPPPNGIFVGPGMMGPPGAALMAGVRPTNLMGASRPPFMGGPGRPNAMSFRPPQPGNWVRRDLQVRRQKNEVGSENFAVASQGQDADFAVESYARDEEDSLSEDEAPRRSRHGEGKKRRRD